MGHFIGIDAGSSFIKAAVLDPDEPALRQTVRVPFPDFLGGLPPGWREVNPGAIMAAIEAALGSLQQGPGTCEGLLLCGQMHGFVLVDEGGQAASNYISWLDQRVSPAECDELAGLVTPDERRELGNEFRASIAAGLLWWMGRHGALPAGATPVSIADYAAARLSGTPPAMEPTQAAAFGALRVSTLGWHTGVIEKLGLAGLRWPEVRPTGSRAGTWLGAPCYLSTGDQQCALAGALLEPGELSINIGTGSQVALLSDFPTAEGCQVRPYFDGRFLHTITHIPGGRALGALVSLMTELGGASEREAWQQIDRAVARVPATDLRASAAFFPGPCGDRGFLENLHEGNLTAGHVFRAVFESMARNYEACARRLTRGAADRAVFSGGVARRSGLLRELTATALGCPYRLSPDPEDTLLGLLVLALAFSGRCGSVGEAAEQVRKNFKPPRAA